MPGPAWSDDQIEEMLQRMGEGETLVSIASDGRMPSVPTMWRWEEAGDELAEKITRARTMGYTGRAEKIVEKVKLAEDAQLARLEFDAERWFLGKMQPKKFGDSATLKHADAEGEKIKLDDVSALTRLASLSASILGRSDEPADDAG